MTEQIAGYVIAGGMGVVFKVLFDIIKTRSNGKNGKAPTVNAPINPLADLKDYCDLRHKPIEDTLHGMDKNNRENFKIVFNKIDELKS